MAKRIPRGEFNKVYLAKVSQESFLSDHKHLEENGYTEIDLKKIWKEAQPKSESKKD